MVKGKHNGIRSCYLLDFCQKSREMEDYTRHPSFRLGSAKRLLLLPAQSLEGEKEKDFTHEQQIKPKRGHNGRNSTKRSGLGVC